jgi:hypothetical protein
VCKWLFPCFSPAECEQIRNEFFEEVFFWTEPSKPLSEKYKAFLNENLWLFLVILALKFELYKDIIG